MKRFRLCSFLLLLLLLLLPCLSSCSEEKYSLLASAESGGMVFCARGNFGKVKQVVVKRGEEVLFAQSVNATRAAGEISDAYGLVVTDLNFDGSPDFILPLEVSGECVSYVCFLYDASSGTFSACDELSGLCNVVADEKLEAVFTFTHIRTVDRAYADVPKTYTDTDRTTMHVWNGSKFVPVRYVSITYYSETDNYCYSVADYDSSAGAFEQSDDRWLTPEEYRTHDMGFLYYFR